jgi:hypothetical protein
MSKKLTTDEFIEKARKIHGNKYDYSKSIYGNSNLDKVIIVCPIHGEFNQSPVYHLSKRGCPLCGLEICQNAQRGTKYKFIEKARKIHGNKYDYSLVDYINVGKKVIIICPTHGKFIQRPSSHLIGTQCPKCGIEKQKKSTTDTVNEFIKKAKSIHGNLYDYSKVVYINNHRKVRMTCKKHGDFLQLPLNHLKRNGCPNCQSSYGENEIARILNQYGIQFIREKCFDDCVNPRTSRQLPFDFWIPSKNLLIEYDGKHHFEIGKFGTYKSTHNELKQIQFRDKIKTKFAKINNIRLLRIKYTKLNKIERLLGDII